ncbi:MAG: cupin domain-containing protein [Clostridia bacterium]
METIINKVENLAGGKGFVTIEKLLGEKELNGKCGLFAKVTIEPGHSLGYHVHHGESETYYMLSGVGEYSDNGTVRTVKAGDVTFTPNGFGHGMENNGTEDVVFMALIIMD